MNTTATRLFHGPGRTRSLLQRMETLARSWLARAGRYEIHYTIPAAAHMGDTFCDDLVLTRSQAARFIRATGAMTVFMSGYASPKYDAVARELEDALNAAYPQYVHPVGVIVDLTWKGESGSNQKTP